MKIYKGFTYFFVAVFIALIMTACTSNNKISSTEKSELSEEAKAICGSWAFNHDKETAIIVLNEDGTAKYEDKDYTFNCDKQFIELKDQDGNILKLRYVLREEDMQLYISTTYTPQKNNKPDSILGEWECAEKRWLYAFTEENKFVEDGVFLGRYTIDEENSTITLIYNEPFEDTVCYYHLNNDELTIEYPWTMVRMNTK